jgi:prephenate dehydratase
MVDRKQQQESTDATPGSSGAQGTGIKVSIQGYEGSFHQVAARQFFGKNVEVIPCATFRDKNSHE